MSQTKEPTRDPLEADDWIAEHVADVDAEVAVIQSLVDAGETTLVVNLPNYLSLHHYLRQVLENYRATQGLSTEYRQRIESLILREELREWKRPVGRPRKVTIGQLSKSKGGRPRKYSDEFFPILNRHVARLVDGAVGKRLGIRRALEVAVDEFLRSDEPDTRERTRKAQRLASVWYKPLMKYRSKAGIRLRQKSQNPTRNSPNFGPLLRFFK